MLERYWAFVRQEKTSYSISAAICLLTLPFTVLHKYTFQNIFFCGKDKKNVSLKKWERNPMPHTLRVKTIFNTHCPKNMSNFLIKTHTVTVGTDAVYVWFLGQIHLNKSQTHTVASALIAAASFLWLFLGQCRNYFPHLQPSRQLKNSTWSYHSPLVASSLIIARSNCNLPTKQRREEPESTSLEFWPSVHRGFAAA